MELIKLGKDMLPRSPTCALPIIPSRRRTSTTPWRTSLSPPQRWPRRPPRVQGETPCRLLGKGHLRKLPCQCPSDRRFSLLHLQHPRHLRQQMWWCPNPCCSQRTRAGAKASATRDTPNIPKAASPPKPATERALPNVPKATSPPKPTPASPSPRTTIPKATPTTPAPPAKSIAAPKTPPKEKSATKAAAGAGGDPRPLIEVGREGLKFKTFDCARCNTVVFVGQHVCFGCNKRLRNTANSSSASRRFLAVSRKNLLRDVCRATNLKFTELTARDIRPTKDVVGKLPKSPEAATLERARNHLVRAKQKGFQTIEDRYNRDPVFAANMMEDGQAVSNIRIWECLTCAVIPATQRGQVPTGETAEDYQGKPFGRPISSPTSLIPTSVLVSEAPSST